jgi:hypothetical protein
MSIEEIDSLKRKLKRCNILIDCTIRDIQALQNELVTLEAKKIKLRDKIKREEKQK